MKHSPFDATISALDVETSALGDCSVGITLQMFNRVTNHGVMGTFSKPVLN